MAKKKSMSLEDSWLGWIILLAGVLYLLQDVNAITWWTLNWYTVAFVLVGIGSLSKK